MQVSINRPHVSGIARKNKIRVGDAVAHGPSKQRGLVVQVAADWVKFEVLGVPGPGGAKMYRRFNYTKLTLLATKEQLQTGFAEFQKQRAAAEKAAKNPLNRLARWVGAKFVRKTAQPQPVR